MQLELDALKTTTSEQSFTLPCGCVAVTREDRSFDVQWCPHHKMLHGVISCSFDLASRSEQRAYGR